jgi:hypothetical protein
MTNKSVRIGCAAAALALMLAGSAIALGSHENRLTFNRPVSLPGVVLPAGSYSFDTHWDNPNVVIVRNKERSKVFYMGFTTQALRPKAMSLKTATLGEGRRTRSCLSPRGMKSAEPDMSFATN